MKKEYTTPVVEIDIFITDYIVTTSGEEYEEGGQKFEF